MEPQLVYQEHSARERYLFWILAGASVIIGLQHAASLWFINDDCFISFRYARNFADGLGLVYNAGERVEGFTNFLWTLIIALGMKLGVDPVPFSTNLGIAFHLSTLLLFALASWKLRHRSPAFFLPLTSLALSVHHDVNAYATGGLETSMFTFFISAAFLLLLFARESHRLLLGGGFLLVLGMMTRPDGVVFLAASALYLLITRKRPVVPLLVFFTPTAVLFLPYWLLRYAYYGFFFPNTFYAKSIALPYYSQGWTYTILYFTTYYVFALLLLLGIVAIIRSMKSAGAVSRIMSVRGEGVPPLRPLLLSFIFAAAYCAFVIRIGGDFMFARFFIVITPMLYVALETLITRLARGRIALLLSAFVLLGTIYRNDQYGKETLIGYIADESRYYTREDLYLAQADGAVLARYFQGLPVRVAFWAAQLKLVYYAGPSYALESSGGLTDTVVAHQTVTDRGHPGHEKNPTAEYLVRRKIHFFIGPMEPLPPGVQVLNAVIFGEMVARIIVYDNRIMSALARYPEVRFVRMPEYLDAYIAGMDTLPRSRIIDDFRTFKGFYFDHNDDSARVGRFLHALGGMKR